MTLKELEDAWNLRRRGRRRERLVLAFFLALLLGGAAWVGWRYHENRQVRAQPTGPAATSPR